jgi:hypothetical protein
MSIAPRPPDTALFRQLWEQQQGFCALCGQAMPATRADVVHATLWKKWRPSFDHVQARARGGSNHSENRQLAHAKCNWEKGRGA